MTSATTDKPDDPTDDRLVCPKCGCRHFRVVYTRTAWGGRIVADIERQLGQQECPCADAEKRYRVSARIVQGRKPSFRGGPVDVDNYVRNVVNAINAEKSGWSGPKVLWVDDNQVDEYHIVRAFDDTAEVSRLLLRICEIPRLLLGGGASGLTGKRGVIPLTAPDVAWRRGA